MDGTVFFQDRSDAGRMLSEKLQQYKDTPRILLAIPRGGVIVGYEVAQKMHLPLDVIISRKIGAPRNPEFAIGAISEGGQTHWNTDALNQMNIEKSKLSDIIFQEKKELERRVSVYRKGRELQDIRGKVVVLVDDGVATGATVLAAVKAIRKYHPKEIIFACPVCSQEAREDISGYVDQILCVVTAQNLSSISNYYQNFQQVTDEKVKQILEKFQQSV
ncbi:phosphoribosyltransferase [Candidatus Gottesmanbacteria bacterium]|nr:phosphoribosyltransferase [Candidatus Gottesmanbacteria bacterium]